MPFITKRFTITNRRTLLSFMMCELNHSRDEAQRVIHRGRITQYGVIQDNPNTFIQGDIELICFEALSKGFEPIFETDDFAVYDKPSGLRVHPYSRKSPYTLNDEIKHRYGIDANATHRIDQETSGLVLVSRHKKSERFIKKLFSDRQITKRYLALVSGHIQMPLDITEPILRHDHPDMSVSMVVSVHESGKPSRTLIKPIRYFPEFDATLVEAIPLTGRTHQIRVHLFHVKHPIIGDPVYGRTEQEIERYRNKELTEEERLLKSGAKRLLLHANSLEFDYGDTRYHIVSQVDFIEQCFEAMKLIHRP